MITTKDAGTQLAAYAEKLIVSSQGTIRAGTDVLAAIVTMDRAGVTKLYGLMPPPSTADARQALKERLVAQDHAIAVLFFSDAWTRDPVTFERNGEMLQGTVETVDGQALVVWSRYTRDPLVFSPIERSSIDAVLVPGDTFHNTTRQ